MVFINLHGVLMMLLSGVIGLASEQYAKDHSTIDLISQHAVTTALQNSHLTVNDKDILLSKSKWVTDDIIRGSQILLEDPLFIAASKSFVGQWMQIMHLADRSHWVVALNKHCTEGLVNIYNSLHFKPSPELMNQELTMMSCRATRKSLLFRIMNVQ